MEQDNHHLHKPVLIGEIKADGQFNVVWKTQGPIKAQPWSPFIQGNDKKKDEPEKQVRRTRVRPQRGRTGERHLQPEGPSPPRAFF